MIKFAVCKAFAQGVDSPDDFSRHGHTLERSLSFVGMNAFLCLPVG